MAKPSSAAPSVVDRMVALVPMKGALLQAGARLPVGWRSYAACRALTAISRRYPPDGGVLTSNMGIASGLRCRVSVRHPVAVFGRPDMLRGLRGPLALAAALCEESDAFLDVGAGLGWFTFYVRARCRTLLPVYAFEPDPARAERLIENIRANGLRFVHVFNDAVGARDGDESRHRVKTDTLVEGLAATFDQDTAAHGPSVTVRSLASLAGTLGFKAACARVDVAGAEYQFLQGAGDAFARVPFLLMAVQPPAHQRGFVPELMSRGGYQAYYVDDYRLEPSDDGAHRAREGQSYWLFCRLSPDALGRRLAHTRLAIGSGEARSVRRRP
ncbi:MAG: FkbM family methyltransferase [Vicinamibacterales bacterium]